MMAGAFGQGQQAQGGGGAPAQTVACAKCNTQNPVGAKFCQNCGTTQQAPQAATVECPACHSPVLADAKFCSSCGQSMLPQPCKNCQTPLQPGAKFCASCGTPV
jgi:membrane protease subunit (stomatin/prohibitin family)